MSTTGGNTKEGGSDSLKRPFEEVSGDGLNELRKRMHVADGDGNSSDEDSRDQSRERSASSAISPDDAGDSTESKAQEAVAATAAAINSSAGGSAEGSVQEEESVEPLSIPTLAELREAAASGGDVAAKLAAAGIFDAESMDKLRALDVVVKMVVMKPLCGAIIGKAGETITEIRKGTTARINIQDLPVPTMESSVTITGPFNEAQKAFAQVFEKIVDFEQHQRGMGGPITDMPLRLLITNSGAGGVIGKRGAGIRALRERLGIEARVASMADFSYGTGERVVSMQGAADRVLVGQQIVTATATLATGGASRGGGGGSGGSSSFRGPVGGVTIEMGIPDQFIGAIIGKGGESITALRKSSNCRITAHPPEAGRADRRLTIVGTPQNVQLAQDMVNMKLLELAARHGGAMGGMPGQGHMGMPGMGGFPGMMAPGFASGPPAHTYAPQHISPPPTDNPYSRP